MIIFGKRNYKKKLTRLRDEALAQKEILIEEAKNPWRQEKWIEAAFFDGKAAAYDNMLFDLDVWGS
jgi:hypothetical protein